MPKRSLKALIVSIPVILLLSSCQLLQQLPLTGSSNIHLTLGNPSNATASLTTPDNYLMEKPQYVVSYNRSKGIPNWSSWQLNLTWLGSTPRRNDFRPDDSLPEGWTRIGPGDYNNSGYDRGHMTPSADRSNTIENNSATFLMTNILPQTPDNNQGPWADLENDCRDLVKQGKELYIIAGGYGNKRKIADGKVTPPARTWKVIVVLDRPGQGVQGITSQTRTIAVDMPNTKGIKGKDWRSFQVSIDQIEAATGYNLLSNISESVQNALESQIDSEEQAFSPSRSK